MFFAVIPHVDDIFQITRVVTQDDPYILAMLERRPIVAGNFAIVEDVQAKITMVRDNEIWFELQPPDKHCPNEFALVADVYEGSECLAMWAFFNEICSFVEGASRPPSMIIVALREQMDGKDKGRFGAFVYQNGVMFLGVGGYGEHSAEDGKGLPVAVEIYDSELRTMVWGDINKADPTHIIIMENAREDHREPDDSGSQ